MFTIRPSVQRGHTVLNWLDSYHTFSFDQYHDSEHMAFGSLRVINEDRIAPGGGFGTHPHRDMEIITYVISGRLKHQDSLGNGSIIAPGEIQKMSAGAGILHSEYNESDTEPVHLLQIWIKPEVPGIKPAYEQERINYQPGSWTLLGAPNGEGLVTIHQKVKLYGLQTLAEQASHFSPQSGSTIWMQIVKGDIQIQGENLKVGDGLAINGDAPIEIASTQSSELLLFELL